MMKCKVGICDENISKYKCPNCRIPYCSVGCWKVHQSENCEVVELEVERREEQVAVPKYQFPTQDTVPIDKLNLLGKDAVLKSILSNHHLRTMMKAIDKAPDPSSIIEAAMLEPIFVEFAEKCLEIIES